MNSQPPTSRRYMMLAAVGLLAGSMFLALAVGDSRDTTTFASEGDSPDKVVFFRERILPILKEHCFRCHSERAETVEADLRLDTREGLLRGGDQGPAVEPGAPDQSLLMTAIRYEMEDLKMPPDRRLEDQQVNDLEKWIRWGVPYGE